jgi:ferredoxin-nitrate reductase
MVSLPDLHQVRRAFSRSELIVLNEVYHPTESSRLADVVLPVAQWGEKDWTSTNAERRVSFSKKLWDAPGEARPDWEIFCHFAKKMNFSGFDYHSSAEIWDEFIPLTKNCPCDQSGMPSRRLREVGSMQWPCRDESDPGSERLYSDHRFATPDGRAVFLPRDHRNPKETPDQDFPFILTTGRVYGHWHTLTRTGKIVPLMKSEPRAFVEIHPDDAQKLGVQNGELIQLTSRRGTIQLPARIEPGITPGTVFVPFHWGDLFGEGNALNYLTIQAIGEIAKQPDFKCCSVQLSRAALPLPAAPGRTPRLARY